MLFMFKYVFSTMRKNLWDILACNTCIVYLLSDTYACVYECIKLIYSMQNAIKSHLNQKGEIWPCFIFKSHIYVIELKN